MKKPLLVIFLLLSMLLLISACSKVETTKPAVEQTVKPEDAPIQAEEASPVPTSTPSPSNEPIVLSTPEPTISSDSEGITEKKLGTIDKVYSKDNIDYIVIDYVDMFFGDEAIAKALEDKVDWVEQDENGQYFIANDYYIRNSNAKLRTFEVSADCVIQVTDFESGDSDGISMKKISFDAFSKLVKKHAKDYYLMHIDVQNGILISMKEQYRP